MDIEKNPRDDAAFATEPRWARLQSDRWKSKHIVKLIFAVVLLGLLGINVLTTIRSTSAPILGSHLPNWAALHGGCNLDMEHSTHAAAPNETWLFTAWQGTGCTKKPAVRTGEGIQTCQAINGTQPYVSLTVPYLAADLQLCFYPDSACSTNATSITKRTSCSPANATYFFVKFSGEAC